MRSVILAGIAAGAAALVAAFYASSATRSVSAPPAADPLVERGRYLVKIMGCNDCHTAGYALAEGRIPESEWLKGDALGWRGPWGTTYAANLRKQLAQLGEDEWVRFARSFRTRPPMPWFALHDAHEDDLRALHRYIVSLGPAGEDAPAYVPPGQVPPGPFVEFPAPPPAASAAPQGAGTS